MRLFDITHPLHNSIAHWPGDAPFRRDLTWQIAKGATVNVSQFSMSTHNGTHADAPFHYDEAGLRMDAVPVERYIGPARLVTVSGRRMIASEDLQGLDLNGVERLLVRTASCPDPTRFEPDFTYFDPGAIKELGRIGVRLLGTDAHSVDASESKELAAHHACNAAGILILENLNLSAVPDGEYELIALPLKLAGADGSPVRAILRTR